ncbi:MAG TPA: phosphoribosylanthranilate isomerase [Acidimicrobiales bacterium]|nr:phosphoribosylanthranilate isomerase [Acidimicrobiales bacterium]
MFVKICGITNEEDALLSVALGADAVGFIFAPSTRQVAPGAVARITARLPGEVMTIGVFRDSLPERVIEVAANAGVKGVQLHGSETPQQVALIRPHVHFLIKAFPAGSAMLDRAGEYEADALLVDAPNPGSGQVFDWRVLEGVPRTNRLILAGGLDPDNVGEAIARVRPWGVDVNSGVEATERHKDHRKLQAFLLAARHAEAELVDRQESAQASETSELYDWEEDE